MKMMRTLLHCFIASLFCGCIPYFKYEVKEPGKNGAVKYTVARGWTSDMPAAMLAASASERERAEAKCIEKSGVAGCYGYAGFGGWYGGASGLPAGYTAGGSSTDNSLIRANERIGEVQSGNVLFAEVVRGQKETNIYLKALANSQEKFQRALIKRKRGQK